MNVPILNLPAQFQSIRDEVLAAVTEVFETQYFVLGPRVKELETRMAALAGMPHGVGVSSGTDALILALMAAGISNGDDVITTPYSFFSSVSCIIRVGAKPVFVDIDPETYNADVSRLESVITDRTRAAIPVHLFGLVCEPEPWRIIAGKHELTIIEDACQAVGARRDGFTAGGIGDFGCFSFYPTKNLGGAGDGGMVLVRDEKAAQLVRMDRVHGGRDRYHHDRVGICGRLDELQAAVLLVKIKHLEEWNEQRRRLARLYDNLLASTPVNLPRVPQDAYHTYHQYVIRAPRRDELRDFLRSRGIGCDVYYPVPLHLQPCFEFLGYRQGQFPEAEKLALEALALPMYAELTTEQVETVCRAITEFYGAGC
ncbi:DegT/DnrJ/EryC1/StrS family aminotransferase [bacterium]|nr:DegT/DnrJ/EryC1/StrS family aminotransferase [bacterium]MBU1984001.1 DegT/DnrJ/EryC1/StrS family aminotransferase [bacterium]